VAAKIVGEIPESISLDVQFYTVVGTPKESPAYKVVAPFLRMDGKPLTIFLAKPKGSTRWVLSDGNQTLSDFSGTGWSLRPAMLTQLVKSYGLKLSDTLMVFEDSDRLLDIRIQVFIQCAVAIDGILRMWGLSSPPRVNAPKEGKESGYAGTELSASQGVNVSPAIARTNPRQSKASRSKGKVAGVRTRR
jgi:hypothetical protein